MAGVAAVLTALVAVGLAIQRRPLPVRPIGADGPMPRVPSPAGVASVLQRREGAVVVAVGLGGAAAILAGPLPGLLVAGLAVVARRVVVGRVEARRRAQVAAAVPDLIDLFLIAASAGQPVAASLAVVAPRSPPPVAPAVGRAVERFGRGLPLDDCLGALGEDTAPDGVALTDALRQAAASGVALVPLLEGVAAAARDQQRRRAQEVARRLPVTMLLPLVACTLPAAVILAVVPVLVVSIGSLSP